MSYEKIFYHIAASTVLIVLVPIMSVLYIGEGVLAGLIFGAVLGDTWAALMTGTGWPLEAWQTGGLAAFVGSFFRPSVNLQRASE
jgi:Na+/H+-translocating membrane pyrophosphatase